MSTDSRRWLINGDSTALRAPTSGIADNYLARDADLMPGLIAKATLSDEDAARVCDRARDLVIAMRKIRSKASGLDSFLGEYDLSTNEGIVLMCIAEALLRIPDAGKADELIADQLGRADFDKHVGSSESVFVNFATWALMLTGKIVSEEPAEQLHHGRSLRRMIDRLGEPLIRAAMRQAMRVIGEQFILGSTIEAALDRAGTSTRDGVCHSFDMLGEAAVSSKDADRYFSAYRDAIDKVGRTNSDDLPFPARDSVSIKLSALCPRFETAQAARATDEIADRAKSLAMLAMERGIALTIDAEEADRLLMTLDVFERLYRDPALRNWPGFGIAVQAYQKRAAVVVDYLAELATELQRPIPVRLVKGAYWDTEIKLAQQQGYARYPVWTRKAATDVSYLACARRLLEASPTLVPQFATHNAHTVAWLLESAAGKEYELQRLHGMGDELYAAIAETGRAPRCRIYAPVGSHRDLLPYLVRRLLENGANSSFVNRFVHDENDIEKLIEDPVSRVLALGDAIGDQRIVEPPVLYGAERPNSAGTNLNDPAVIGRLQRTLEQAALRQDRQSVPRIGGQAIDGQANRSIDPADPDRIVGHVEHADADAARLALRVAGDYFEVWNGTPAARRSEILRTAADLFERHQGELAMLCVSEAGRTVPDALAEVREAVDFLRYYALECERLFAEPLALDGPTGERNLLRMTGRGVFVCISPWNFPIAIFTGQIAAALAAGNTVIAKPAEQTPIVACLCIDLLQEAGVPGRALQFLPGDGATLGNALLPDPRVAGVAFTGSTETARIIHRALAERPGQIAALIAETGGVNAMIVDSSALAPQVVHDVLRSAFNSAGQRCSALRLLCLQDEIATGLIELIKDAMDELVIGDPALLNTDVGPVIDGEAHAALEAHIAANADRVIHRCALPAECQDRLYVAPTLIELEKVGDLRNEVFGPVIHIVRYSADAIDALIDDINALGFGLTLGVHSRIQSLSKHIVTRARAGNAYVNRDMIGAVVGVQPFGGMGLSGTGPKAGGPNYLTRFATEQSVSTNTAAIGGNATLLSLTRLEAPKEE